MKIFYRDEQSAVGTTYFSPSPMKPAKVMASWKKLRDSEPAEVVGFDPVMRRDLYKVHAEHYVDGVLDGVIENGFGDVNESIIQVLPYVAGSMVAATLHAYKTGETAISPTSGAHHAGYGFGGGFCTFNFLALAAVEAHEAGAKRVGIIDCDAHWGNGTDNIIKTLNLDYIEHYSFGSDHSKLVPKEWLKKFERVVERMCRACDVVIYNAGADCHTNDPLGGDLTTEEMRLRDEIVFGVAMRFDTPVAVSLAGGYQDPIDPVLEIHDNMYRSAFKHDHAKMEMKRNIARADLVKCFTHV